MASVTQTKNRQVTASLSATRTAIAMTVAALCLTLLPGTAHIAFATENTSESPASASSNAWQIVEQNYSDVTAGDGIYLYSADNAVRIQKAVAATSVENEFNVFLNVEPQLSWQEFFEGLDDYASHNSSSTFNPHSGCSKLVSQDEFEALPAESKTYWRPIQVRFTLGDGSSVSQIRYGNFFGPDNAERVQPVPNGSYYWSSQTFGKAGLITGINWRALVESAAAGGNLQLEVDMSSLAEDFTFAAQPVCPTFVEDELGRYMLYEGHAFASEGVLQEPPVGSEGSTILWELAPADGTTTPAPVVIVAHDGKLSAYYTGVFQLRYAVGINVLGEGFESCAPLEASPAGSIYPVNAYATLTYHAGDGANETLDFPIPKVRGLLYDIEVAKADESHPDKGLAGALFGAFTEDGLPAMGAGGLPVTVWSLADGTAKLTGLPWGTYTVKELSAPDGYVADEDTALGPYVLCYTTNAEGLVQDHEGIHSADKEGDATHMTAAGEMQVLANRPIESPSPSGDDSGEVPGGETPQLPPTTSESPVASTLPATGDNVWPLLAAAACALASLFGCLYAKKKR